MPNNDGALFSLRAHGTLNKDVVYYVVAGKQRSRSYAVPVQPNTPSQLTAQSYFRSAVASFHSASTDTVRIWNEFALINFHGSRTGYNCYLSHCLTYLKASGGIPPVQPFLPDTVYVPPQYGSISGSLTGEISEFQTYNAQIYLTISGQPGLISSLILTNGQSVFSFTSLLPNSYKLQFLADEPGLFYPVTVDEIQVQANQNTAIDDVDFMIQI